MVDGQGENAGKCQPSQDDPHGVPEGGAAMDRTQHHPNHQHGQKAVCLVNRFQQGVQPAGNLDSNGGENQHQHIGVKGNGSQEPFPHRRLHGAIVPGIQMQQGGYQGIGTSGHHHGIAGIEHAGSHGAGLAEKILD